MSDPTRLEIAVGLLIATLPVYAAKRKLAHIRGCKARLNQAKADLFRIEMEQSYVHGPI